MGYDSAGGKVQTREEPPDLVGERTVDVDQPVGERSGALEQRPILAQVGEVQIGESRLSGSEELAAAADLEVDLGGLEAVGRAHERLEARDRRIRQVLARAR